jgi:prevent-host-death family protein
MQVNILEAKNRLSQLVKAAQAGEDVVIANRGEPVVRLVPTETPLAARAPTGNGRAILAIGMPRFENDRVDLVLTKRLVLFGGPEL